MVMTPTITCPRIRLFKHALRTVRNKLLTVESRQGSGSSMESPKWEQISYFEAGVLIVD
jgi:hypothetical protein